ncbi:hypothetical protein VZO05_14490 [Aggregatilineales bacterium SYSU G02658]
MTNDPNNINPPLRLLVAFEALTQQPPEVMMGVAGREVWLAGVWGHHERWQVHVPDWEAQVIFNAASIAKRQNAAGRLLPPWARPLIAAWQMLDSAHHLPSEGARFVIVADDPPGPRYEFSVGLAFAAACYARSSGSVPPTSALIDALERRLRLIDR